MTQAKYMHRSRTKVCPIHISVQKKSTDYLEKLGVFSKSQVLNDLGLSVIANSIYWDHIREFIETDENCELVPLAASYFKRHGKEREIVNPSAYLASGHGKKTEGYCSVSSIHGHLAVQHLKHRTAISNGVGKAVIALAHELELKQISMVNQEQVALAPPNEETEH